MEQFSGNGRGFSFQIDEPLIMTFGKPEKYSFVARDIVNDWEEEDIKNVLKGYGEERFSGRIARHIVLERKKAPILTTYDLVRVIELAVPVFYTKGRIHHATRTFQALRIAVNDEFDALETFIKKSIAHLSENGRLAIITFHSTEDRIVKHLFKTFSHDRLGIVLTKKPIIAGQEELKKNPRARSAKLRIFEKHEEIQ
jgi:16S rRNA (cytosine1402-N4)-methyltransferase